LHEIDVRFVPWRNRIESGPANTLGPIRYSLAVGPRTEGGHYGATVTQSLASGKDITHQSIVHGRATQDVTRDEYASTVTGWDGPIWQEVVDAPDDVLPPEYPRIADEHVESRSDPTPILSLSLHPPSGGQVPGDWIGRGLLPGERFWCRTDLGPKSDSALRRITRIRVTPPDGDRVEIEAVDA
jgi:hypothetical protein